MATFLHKNIKITINNGQCYRDDQTSSGRHSIIHSTVTNPPDSIF